MASLDMTDAKAAKLDKLEDKALDVLIEAMTGENDVSDEAKLAMKALNAVAKNRQTLTARSGIELAMATRVLDDGQIAKYVEASSPVIGKLLKG